MRLCRGSSPARFRRLVLTAVIGLALAGCRPTAVFFGDPAFRATVPDPQAFAAVAEQAADEAGYRITVEWDPSEELSTGWLDERLGVTKASVAALSPYFSLFAVDLAEARPDVRFIALGEGGAARANVIRVAYDKVPAMREAGRLISEWEHSSPGRLAAGLFLTDTARRESEKAALVEGYRAAGFSSPHIQEFATLPDRDTVRYHVRELLADGVNAFLVFLGTSDQFALELLQSEPVVFAGTSVMSAPSLYDSLLCSVESPVGIAIGAALNVADDDDGVITVSSVVVTGGGYSSPQLSVPEPDGEAGGHETGQPE